MDTKNEVYMIIINFCQLVKVGKPVGHPLLEVSYVIFGGPFGLKILLKSCYFEFLLIIKLGKQN